jgi:decaprenyl-phosphate phosphoribosyltransferase
VTAATAALRRGIGRPSRTALTWARAIRPHQWIKNVTVLGAPAAASVLNQPAVLARSSAAAAIFVLASCGTYLLNDAHDAEADRRHPEKRRRPVAANEITVRAAVAVGGIACIAAAVGAFALAREFGLVVTVYLVMTGLYSWRLKQVAVIEMMLIASGFVLRAIGGGVVNHLPISRWFLLVSAAGALFIVSGKRQAEQRALGANAPVHRAVIRQYSAEWLQQTATVALTATVVGYCLWAFQYLGRDILQVLLAISVAPFTAALLRYTQLISLGHGQRPERYLVTDPFLVTAILTCASLLFFGLYVA